MGVYIKFYLKFEEVNVLKNKEVRVKNINL
jgi:hypothetical protein